MFALSLRKLNITMSLNAIRGTVTGIIRLAGAEVMRYFDQPHEETIKQNINDIVTEGDHASEAVIVPALLRAFPGHHIVTEEGGGMGAPAEEAEFFWYIDPIDGTTNFANDIPHFSISIALTDRERNPLVGVVLNPATNELFSAAAGCGATLNGRRLRVSSTDSLSKAVLATGFPYNRATNPENNIQLWNTFLMQARDVRRFGSAALDLCYVAAGRFDGFWESWLNPWDCLAGIVCVHEAGGVVTDYHGGTHNLNGRQLVASNGHLHADILRIIAEHS